MDRLKHQPYMYTPMSLLIEPNQEKKIATALKKGLGCVIRVCKPSSKGADGPNEQSPMAQKQDCSGKSASRGILLLTPKHIDKYNNAQLGTSVPLKFRSEHLQENLTHKGVFCR